MISFLSFQFFPSFSDTEKNVNLKFNFSIKLPALWAVSITIGCTAGSLTACRLRTFVMTNYISYTKLDFLNLFL